MRSVLILAMFGMLLLLPVLSHAETTAECQARCSTEMSSGLANCPPPGGEARAQCLQELQDSFRHCIDGCPQAAPADTPKDTPKDTPAETPPPADTPKDN